jgi:hypothetical protein
MKKVSKQVISLELEKPKKDKIIRAKRRAKKPKFEDLPLYHALEIGAGLNIKTRKSQPVTMYISDELLRASEEDRMRRMAKVKKITENKNTITIKPEINNGK